MATTVQDYDDQEQLEITLHCLANYLLVTPHVWREGVASLKESVQAESLGLGQIMIADAAGQAFTPFTAEYGAHAQRLFGLLREAWPAGAQDFEGKFHAPEESK